MLSTNFIAATKEFSSYEYETHIPAPYIRKTFSIENTVKSAKITICGLGFYELYINGGRITKGHLAPYISNPDDILYYDEYEINSLLSNGKNAIGIMLGNGMLNCIGGTVWQMEQAVYRSAPKVALSLEITYENGETDVITADESFKTHPSAILFDDLRCGEIYDANKEIDGWNLPDFDDSDWKNCILAETPRGETKICTAEPIVCLKELNPVSITPNKKVVFSEWIHPYLKNAVVPMSDEEKQGWIYDFGENLAGIFTLKIKGEKGQRISIQTGELLTEDGDLDLRGMQFQPTAFDHRAVYTLKGEGEEEYTSTFTYYGFRYCLVSGITKEQATKDLLTYKVMSSDLQKNGDFSCSDNIANKLQKAAYNSDIANFYYFPTDCPHREKNGWTADAALSAEQMLFNLTPENSYHVWLDNIRKAQREDGALPGIIPTSGWGFDWGNGPAWDSVLFYLPYYTWVQRGDTDIIKENANAMMRYLHYISGKRDEMGLIHIGLGDWLPVNYKTPYTPLEVTDTLVTLNLCRMAEKMFAAVDMIPQSIFAGTLFDEIREDARTALILPDRATILGRSQTAQAMAIEFGLLDEGEKPAAFNVLLELIHAADDHMDTGCLGARIIFHVLAKFGYADLAYNMIVRTDFPSYGFWVEKQDATSLFEDFNSPDKSPQSKNHHFFGDISSWFFKYISGVKINPCERNVKEVEISPNFIESLDHAEGYQNHLGGKISAEWKRQGNEINLKVTIPEGCYGFLKLPIGYVITDKGDKRLAMKPLSEGVTEYVITKQD